MMERVMAYVANGLLHFGWALTGTQCGCAAPKLNGFARLMAGIDNKTYGMSWSEDDFTEEDKRTWWEVVDNPNLLGRVTGWICDRLHSMAFALNEKYDGKLL